MRRCLWFGLIQSIDWELRQGVRLRQKRHRSVLTSLRDGRVTANGVDDLLWQVSILGDGFERVPPSVIGRDLSIFHADFPHPVSKTAKGGRGRCPDGFLSAVSLNAQKEMARLGLGHEIQQTKLEMSMDRCLAALAGLDRARAVANGIVCDPILDPEILLAKLYGLSGARARIGANPRNSPDSVEYGFRSFAGGLMDDKRFSQDRAPFMRLEVTTFTLTLLLGTTTFPPHSG